MKKTIIAITTIMILASCNGSGSQTVNATYSDTVGPDSSQILPARIDSIDKPVSTDSDMNKVLPDSLQ